IPVAELLWAGEAPFEEPAIIQRCIDGRPLHIVDAAQSVATDRPDEELVLASVEALAQLHRVPVPDSFTTWGQAALTTQIVPWADLAERSASHADTHRAPYLASLLMDLAPAAQDGQKCFVHGDFQPNNILYGDDGTLLAIVD